MIYYLFVQLIFNIFFAIFSFDVMKNNPAANPMALMKVIRYIDRQLIVKNNYKITYYHCYNIIDKKSVTSSKFPKS